MHRVAARCRVGRYKKGRVLEMSFPQQGNLKSDRRRVELKRGATAC